MIHTSSGDQEELVCIVHSSPHATVTWLKNGQPIDTATNVISQRGNKHSLTLVDINEDMFGQYTCRATNKLGTVEKSTQISGNDTILILQSSVKTCKYTLINSCFT